MKILKRYRNSKGMLEGFDVQLDNGAISYFNQVDTINLEDKITNATLTKRADFRAKKGYHIETKITAPSLENIRKFAKHNYYDNKSLTICKIIRNYALKGLLEIDKDNTKNTKLCKLLEICDISIEKFMKEYLCKIQPYTLEGSDDEWRSNLGYNTYVKIELKEVSIYVSIEEGKGIPYYSNKLCAVIVEKVAERPNCVGVDFTVQRGFIEYNIHAATQHYVNGIALVDYKDIKTAIDGTLNTLYKNLVDVYLVNCEDTPITLKTSSIVNNICLMIDLYAKYTDSKSRQVVSDLTMNLLSEVPKNRLKEIQLALKQKYLDSRNKLYLTIEKF